LIVFVQYVLVTTAFKTCYCLLFALCINDDNQTTKEKLKLLVRSNSIIITELFRVYSISVVFLIEYYFYTYLKKYTALFNLYLDSIVFIYYF